VEDPIKVLIAEGGTEAPGMFRFVLEGEGFDVLAETRSVSDLVSAMATHEPEVVVMSADTGLGAIAYVRAVSDAKVVLISANGAHAGAADAQVDVASVMSELGPTIEQLCGGSERVLTGSFERPAWIDKVRKDPKTLREILAKGRSVLPSRPSVTELQRRAGSRRLRPVRRPPGESAADEGEPAGSMVAEPTGIADVVVLPTAASQEVVTVPEAEVAPAPDADAEAGAQTAPKTESQTEPEAASGSDNLPDREPANADDEPGGEPVRLSHPHKR
jgi:hypothetical protein